MFVFLLLKKRKSKKMITGISGFVVLVQNGCFVTVNCFGFLACWNPYFIVFGGVRVLGQVVKNVFGDKTKHRKVWLTTEKLILGVLFVFLFLKVFFLVGFKGQVRWPEEPTSLALNPPHFLHLFFGFVFCFLSFLIFRTKPCFPP